MLKSEVQSRLNKREIYGGFGPGDQEEEETKMQLLL